MSWIQDVISGLLKGIDSRGRLRLDQNNSVPVPIDQIPQDEIDHTELENIGTNTHAQIDTHIANTSNPHAVTDAQVCTGKSGSIHFIDSDAQAIDLIVVNGRLTSILLNGGEQLS